MNIRVHPNEARQSPNFSSIELNDGSGDMMGMPTVFHGLHCLVSWYPSKRLSFSVDCEFLELTRNVRKRYANMYSPKPTLILGSNSSHHCPVVSAVIWITALKSELIYYYKTGVEAF